MSNAAARIRGKRCILSPFEIASPSRRTTSAMEIIGFCPCERLRIVLYYDIEESIPENNGRISAQFEPLSSTPRNCIS